MKWKTHVHCQRGSSRAIRQGQTGLIRRLGRFNDLRSARNWVAETMFPGIANGFFLGVGSGDGYLISNTQALEARGWKGICVDPFPTTMGGRTCHGEYVIQGGAEKRLNLFSAPPLAPS